MPNATESAAAKLQEYAGLPDWAFPGGLSSAAQGRPQKGSWKALLYNYYEHRHAASLSDPFGMAVYKAHWLPPWMLGTSGDGARVKVHDKARRTLVSLIPLVRRKSEEGFCCPGLRYGARLPCTASLDVEVVREADRSQLSRHERRVTVHLYPNDAHNSINGLLKRTVRGGAGQVSTRVVNVVASMEPPTYNSVMKTGDAGTMRKFDLGYGFKASARHVPAPYILMRDGHNIFSRLRLSFAERTEPRAGVFVVGNCGYGGNFPRRQLLQGLMKLLPIDAVGNCLRNTERRVGGGEPAEMANMSRYKFLLAFENSVCDAYITEKAMRAYRLQLVPVVYEHIDHLGARVPGYETFFPRGSYVNAGAFPSVRALAEHLRLLSEDESVWLRYMAHRTQQGPVLRKWMQVRDVEGACMWVWVGWAWDGGARLRCTQSSAQHERALCGCVTLPALVVRRPIMIATASRSADSPRPRPLFSTRPLTRRPMLSPTRSPTKESRKGSPYT